MQRSFSGGLWNMPIASTSLSVNLIGSTTGSRVPILILLTCSISERLCRRPTIDSSGMRAGSPPVIRTSETIGCDRNQSNAREMLSGEAIARGSDTFPDLPVPLAIHTYLGAGVERLQYRYHRIPSGHQVDRGGLPFLHEIQVRWPLRLRFQYSAHVAQGRDDLGPDGMVEGTRGVIVEQRQIVGSDPKGRPWVFASSIAAPSSFVRSTISAIAWTSVNTFL